MTSSESSSINLLCFYHLRANLRSWPAFSLTSGVFVDLSFTSIGSVESVLSKWLSEVGFETESSKNFSALLIELQSCPTTVATFSKKEVRVKEGCSVENF